MKRSDTGKTFLDLEDINSILPESLKLNTMQHARGVYQASNGDLISISNSRLYDKGYLSWYYVYADRYAEMGVKHMLFTIGLTGLVVVPMSEFQGYKAGCYWKSGRLRGEKRYRVDIAKREGKLMFVNSSQRHERYLDVSDYFIPYNENE